MALSSYGMLPSARVVPRDGEFVRYRKSADANPYHPQAEPATRAGVFEPPDFSQTASIAPGAAGRRLFEQGDKPLRLLRISGEAHGKGRRALTEPNEVGEPPGRILP